MITLGMKVPMKIYLAYSGGVDSAACLDFLLQGGRDIEIVYVNHGDAVAEAEMDMVSTASAWYGIKSHIFKVDPDVKALGREGAWSRARNQVFETLDRPVVTGHHLDDQIETWVWSALNGNPYVMRPQRGNIMKPFMLNKKDRFHDRMNGLPDDLYVEDVTNFDVNYATRNFIRHELLPKCRVVNPGLDKVVRKRVIAEYEHARKRSSQELDKRDLMGHSVSGAEEECE